MVAAYEQKLSRDVIQVMSDQDISRLMFRYKSRINHEDSGGLNTHNLEMDYCYLQREMQLREKRPSS